MSQELPWNDLEGPYEDKLMCEECGHPASVHSDTGCMVGAGKIRQCRCRLTPFEIESLNTLETSIRAVRKTLASHKHKLSGTHQADIASFSGTVYDCACGFSSPDKNDLVH
jgi:hypothetical protein